MASAAASQKGPAIRAISQSESAHRGCVGAQTTVKGSSKIFSPVLQHDSIIWVTER